MKTEAEIIAIIRREREYWLRQEGEDTAGIVMGAVGALANVLCSIYGFKTEPRPRRRSRRRRKA